MVGSGFVNSTTHQGVPTRFYVEIYVEPDESFQFDKIIDTETSQDVTSLESENLDLIAWAEEYAKEAFLPDPDQRHDERRDDGF